MNLLSFLLPIGIKIVEHYVASSSSSKDDKILEVVKTGADYLVNKQADVVPVALNAIESYTKNSSSKYDEEVLKTVKQGVKYLAGKDNNHISNLEYDLLRDIEINKVD